MSTMESLNAQYVRAIKIADTLRLYEGKIKAEMDSRGQNDTEKAVNMISLLQELSREIDCSEYELMKDTIRIGTQYKNCVNVINTYKAILMKSNNGNASAAFSVQDQVVQAQKKYDTLKATFLQKYKFSIDSVKTLNQIIHASIVKFQSNVQGDVECLKDQAKELAFTEYTTELKQTDPIVTDNALPTDLLVARVPVQNVSLPIMLDIGITSTYQDILIDLRNQGNVMVLSDFEHIEDRRIDEFIIAFILRFIGTFPLGSVNVHIFDQNTNFLYKRLNNSFQSENSAESAKKIIQIHTAYSDLAVFRDVSCEDIFKKTSVARPDLYAIYEDDRSDPFNLIILRDGLVDGSGYASADILDMINSLTKPEEIGHKCGLRFLIVDNSLSFEKNLTASNKHYLSSIRQNCALKIQFNDMTGFSSSGKSVDVLHISGNLV